MAMLPNPLPKLADDPTGSSLGLQLPPGTVLDAEGHPALLWYADEPAAPGVWTSLLPARRAAGLHPVLLDVEEQAPEDWDLDPGMMSYPGDHDPEEVLAELWESEEDEESWPGLAPAQETSADPDDRAAEVASSFIEEKWSKDFRAALVPARRSADIPAAIGWTGPVNYEPDVAALCSVLRSWEDRFGIRVVALAFDQLILSVAAPPKTLAEAEAVAAEHFAFCPDNINQGKDDYDDLSAYAEQEILGKDFWRFWWD
ncbi:DUF4253 domain-containing protein [Streptomyces sp. NBC_01262]|uniref:DUF4253 domain-containing protein n=1 Tax=Streptomyces sp. NBC_01262 TaxID=2903803 RepID=UPI002E2FB1B5|nr:DUF4253 domain-containing protein [Streptomyces sp. NBC_01262]